MLVPVTISGRSIPGLGLFRYERRFYGVAFNQRSTDPTGGTGTGSFATLAGQWWTGPDDDALLGTLDGVGIAAKLYVPNGACIGADGYLYVAEFGFEANDQPFPEITAGNCVRRIDRSTGAVTTLVGLPAQSGGFVNGNAATARLQGCVALFPTTTGLLLAEYHNNALRFITYSGEVSTVAAGLPGCNGVCRGADGTIYVALYAAVGTVLKITPLGTISTIATLNYVANIALSADEQTLYAVQFVEQKISAINLTNNSVSLLTNATGPNANGVALGNGVLYFVCSGPIELGDVVKKVSLSTGTVTTIAGVTRGGDPWDPSSHFNGLSCCAFDGTHLYVGESWGSRITKLLPS